MKIKQKIISLAFIFSLFGVGGATLLPAQTASAADGEVQCSVLPQAICNKANDKTTDAKQSAIWQLLLVVLNIMTAGIGIAAVGGILYGSILYTTAADKPEQTKKAINVILNVVIGIVAYLLMYAFLQFLIPGGVLN